MKLTKHLLFVGVFYAIALVFFHNWNDFLLGNGDSYGYYNYLPSLFIHQDILSAEGRETTYARYKNHTDRINDDFTPADIALNKLIGIRYKDRQIISYTCGVAIMEMPGFLVGHLIATPLGYKRDGYSLPYRVSLAINGCLFALLGLFFLQKILARYVDESSAGITILIIGLATNLFFFACFNPFMSHNYTFTLVAMLIWATIRFYESTERRYLYAMALLLGFITLIRVSDLLLVTIPLFYKVYSWPTLRDRVVLLFQQKASLLIALLLFCLPFFPQLLYWKLQTGQWFFNSYGDAVRFNFAHPEIIKGLFSFSNGWLAYTPVMYLALIGIVFLFKKRDFLLPILLFLPCYIFLIYSWWCWNYINGFGSRPMINAYALLAIPLAMCIAYIRKMPIWARMPLLLLPVLCGILNVWQTQQMNLRVLHSEEGSLPYVLNILTKTKLDHEALVAFDVRTMQPSKTTLVKKIYENTFEDSTASPKAILENVSAGKVAYKVDAGAFLPAYAGTLAEFEGAKWIKVSVKGYSPQNDIYDIYQKTALVLDLRRGSEVLDWCAARLENKLGEANSIHGGKPNVWGEVSYYVAIPSDAQPTDEVHCMIWCNNTFPIIVDDIKVEAHR